MSLKKLKFGDKVPIEKFHISKCNVRHDEEDSFGEDEDDKLLIHQIVMTKKIVDPFKVRVEKNGLGVFTGGRRFLAAKKAGFKEFTYGEDFLIEDLEDEDAVDQSMIENVPFLKKRMDPVLRARIINERISSLPGGISSYAGKLGIGVSTLNEWLRILDLTPKMQEKVQQKKLLYSDGLRLARMDLSKTQQNELADTLETEGFETFQKRAEEISDRTLKKRQRGIPAGKYEILRITFDKVYEPDMKVHKKLKQLAEKEHKKLDEYAKTVLEQHVKKA